MTKKQAKNAAGIPDFPSLIYVVREGEGADSYLVAHETLDGIDNGAVVGRYGLLEVGEIEVTRRLKG